MKKTIFTLIINSLVAISFSQEKILTNISNINGKDDFIYKDGFIGLGMTQPNGILHLKMKSNGTDDGFTLESNSGNSIWKIHSESSVNQGYGDKSLLFCSKTTGRYVMTLSSNRNVGFGTTQPNGILHLKMKSNGTDDGFTLESNSGNSIWKIHSESSVNQGYGDKALLFFNKTTGKYVIGLNSDGNVGIGTLNTKGFKLAVKGKIGAGEIEVKSPEYWPDFVFNSDYNLKPLNEIESFIEQNNHLPDIPSKKEVKERGINLGNMNAKLLQKIEELTLYMIEQNKKTERLINENQKLKNRIIKLENR
jgi:hypothetical protein